MPISLATACVHAFSLCHVHCACCRYATYFEGNKAMGLEPDNEARDIWLRYLPAERVLQVRPYYSHVALIIAM